MAQSGPEKPVQPIQPVGEVPVPEGQGPFDHQKTTFLSHRHETAETPKTTHASKSAVVLGLPQEIRASVLQAGKIGPEVLSQVEAANIPYEQVNAKMNADRQEHYAQREKLLNDHQELLKRENISAEDPNFDYLLWRASTKEKLQEATQEGNEDLGKVLRRFGLDPSDPEKLDEKIDRFYDTYLSEGKTYQNFADIFVGLGRNPDPEVSKAEILQELEAARPLLGIWGGKEAQQAAYDAILLEAGIAPDEAAVAGDLSETDVKQAQLFAQEAQAAVHPTQPGGEEEMHEEPTDAVSKAVPPVVIEPTKVSPTEDQTGEQDQGEGEELNDGGKITAVEGMVGVDPTAGVMELAKGEGFKEEEKPADSLLPEGSTGLSPTQEAIFATGLGLAAGILGREGETNTQPEGAPAEEARVAEAEKTVITEEVATEKPEGMRNNADEETASAAETKEAVLTNEGWIAARIHEVLSRPENAELKKWYEEQLKLMPEMRTTEIPVTGRGGWSGELVEVDGKQEVKSIKGSQFKVVGREIRFFAEDGTQVMDKKKQTVDGVEQEVEVPRGWEQPVLVNNAPLENITFKTPQGEVSFDVSGFVVLLEDEDHNVAVSLQHEPTAQTPKRVLVRTPVQASITKLQQLLDGDTTKDANLAKVLPHVLGDRTFADLVADGTIKINYLLLADANRIDSRNLTFTIPVSNEAREQITADGTIRMANGRELKALAEAGLMNGHLATALVVS